jgi:hypothetical protein
MIGVPITATKWSMAMTDQERAMRMAIDQLRELRHANEVLRARVETMDLLGAFVLAIPPQQRGQGMGEDAAWLLQRELDRMQPKAPATVEELDAILNSEDDTPVNINRDGSVSAAAGGINDGRVTGDTRSLRPGNRN